MTAQVGQARTVTETLRTGRNFVDPALRAAVGSLPESMQRIVGHHFGWLDEHGDPVDEDQGKAIRPTLVLLAGRAVGADPLQVLPAAVAVELVHNFSLLHDDVMDGDLTRRHRPTAWSVFGSGPAILAGDALLTLAAEVLTSSGHPAAIAGLKELNATVLDLVDGQSSDMSFERRSDVALPECLTMVGSKTGALLSCSCALGAFFGGASEERVEHLRRFGFRLGLAFQLVDDVLGIWGDPAVTGKPVHSDLRNRKKSLPVVAALNSGTAAGRELAELYADGRELSEQDAVRAARLVSDSGARDWSRTHIGTLEAEALHHLNTAGPEPGPAAELTELTHMLTRRRN
ncbi:family 2 encapsulin nanocompartment cargo protein polyprenyl transferase [Saccharopolyspora sp. NFXS83]|uniref:family 2 encapsulin nanocompartment cargo protein polyprenyl transferase n=1 Tax=Saccharopolyspora sp. NFXS83 TaxID=2993560 RepID=UPI00224AB64D|nr:family 2 encapsulin nanocompartment cargo protein polyprenyl transferase [Saccharopolyspora sp. NFXS83]MCX2733459.1 family 2 encapsulin nanocompartment cargo protein polyprenyl transferase [Saccharopolyspora sp. NFXS83]